MDTSAKSISLPDCPDGIFKKGKIQLTSDQCSTKPSDSLSEAKGWPNQLCVQIIQTVLNVLPVVKVKLEDENGCSVLEVNMHSRKRSPNSCCLNREGTPPHSISPNSELHWESNMGFPEDGHQSAGSRLKSQPHQERVAPSVDRDQGIVEEQSRNHQHLHTGLATSTNTENKFGGSYVFASSFDNKFLPVIETHYHRYPGENEGGMSRVVLHNFKPDSSADDISALYKEWLKNIETQLKVDAKSLSQSATIYFEYGENKDYIQFEWNARAWADAISQSTGNVIHFKICETHHRTESRL